MPAPKHLQDMHLCGREFLSWSKLLKNDDNEAAIPLFLANIPIIPKIGDRTTTYSLTPDPLPEVNTAQRLLDQCSQNPDLPASIFQTYRFHTALFLHTGFVVLLYKNKRDLQQDISFLPAAISNHIVLTAIASIVPTIDVGDPCQMVGTSLPSSFGVTVRENATGNLFNTIPTHMPHEIWMRTNWWIWRRWRAFWGDYDQRSWGSVVDATGQAYPISHTFDNNPDPLAAFPAGFTSDISLASTAVARSHPQQELTWHPHARQIPQQRTFRIMNQTINPVSIPDGWITHMGIGITRTEPTTHTVHFAMCHLWRGIQTGTAAGDAQKTSVGISGSTIAHEHAPGKHHVLGFQSFEIRAPPGRAGQENGSSLLERLTSAGDRFYGSFILPDELVRNFTIV